jgi:hypothetical protein
MTTTKKQQNNSIRAAALLLSMPVEKLEELLDIQMTLSVCQTEKRQIADMYKKLYADNEKLEAEHASLKAKYSVQ